MSKVKNILAVILATLFIFGFSIWNVLLPDKDISRSERRNLEQFPTLSMDTISSGEFMKNFEKYTLDQFPMRDFFRTIKATTAYYPMAQKDNNKFYNIDGYIVKMEYPLNEESVSYATSRFDLIYNRWLKNTDTNIYLSIVPDKNYFAAEKGYLSLDYEKMVNDVKSDMSYAEYIDIFPTLELSDYYKTDTHWRQEKIIDTARVLAEGMGVTLKGEYETKKVDTPFYGVYYGQSALSYLPADDLCYLTNETMQNCTVTTIDSGKPEEIPLYDMDKLTTDDPSKVPDPYEMFLSGPNRGYVIVENPNATTDKELVIIRDSYSNAIAPLLFEGYKKVTLVDMRKANPYNLGMNIPFTNQDVLFLQSTLVLNNSSEIN